MGFLDNLESSLDNMERGSEREDTRREDAARDESLEEQRAAAPFADALRKSDWTQRLLTECVSIGHGQRTRVNMAWIGDVLRLDAKERRMELRPMRKGIEAVMSNAGHETSRELIDLRGDPVPLAQRWLTS